MKKIDGFVIRRLGKEAMIVAESVDLVDFDRIISLNPTAAYIWESLGDKDFNADTATDLLMQRYDVERDTARADVEELLQIWLKAGIIRE